MARGTLREAWLAACACAACVGSGSDITRLGAECAFPGCGATPAPPLPTAACGAACDGHPTRDAGADAAGVAGSNARWEFERVPAPELAVLVVDVGRRTRGRLLALDATDGRELAQTLLDGPGYRFTKPLVDGDTVIVPSCASDAGPSHLEMFRLRRASTPG